MGVLSMPIFYVHYASNDPNGAFIDKMDILLEKYGQLAFVWIQKSFTFKNKFCTKLTNEKVSMFFDPYF